MKRCRKLSVKRCRILELPSHLIYVIFCRLTVETIFNCKCVCKTFLDILTDPHFVELHFAKASKVNDCLIFVDYSIPGNVTLVYDITRGVEYFKKKRKRDRPEPQKIGLCQTLAMPAAARPNSYSTVAFTCIYGVCNGLVYIVYCFVDAPIVHYICNPVLGEFFALPPLAYLELMEYCGFGFCPKTKEYKVIRFNGPNCMIYTLGKSSHWRKVDNVPYPKSWWFLNTFFNGNLHWLTECTTTPSSNPDVICSFNLKTEKFMYIPLPAHLNPDIVSKIDRAKLGLLGGLLCFSYWLEDQYEAFVMKDYDGVGGGCWTKQLSFNMNSIPGGKPCMYVVDVLNNEELLFETKDRLLVCLNIGKGTTRNVLVKKALWDLTKCYAPSLVSLKGIITATGENVQVVRRKIGRDPWSDNGLSSS